MHPQVGFLDTELNWLFFLNRIIDLVFVVDMILQFFTAFQRPNSIWCYSIPEIRTRYLTSWCAAGHASFGGHGLCADSVCVRQQEICESRIPWLLCGRFWYVRLYGFKDAMHC